MWGAAFSDLAKKAEVLQKQASETTSAAALWNTSSFFNLDAMQKASDEDDALDDDNNSLKTSPNIVDDTLVVQLMPQTTSNHSMHAIIEEEHPVVLSSEFAAEDVEPQRAVQTPEATTVAVTKAQNAVAKMPSATVENESPDAPVQREVEPSNSACDIVDTRTKDDDPTEPALLAGDEKIENGGLKTKIGITEQDRERCVDPGQSLCSEPLDEDSGNAELLGPTSPPTGECNTVVGEPAAVETISQPRDTEDSSDRSNPSPNSALKGNVAKRAEDHMMLVLTSSQPLARSAQNRQLRGESILSALGWQYETIDGADPVHTQRRDELFEISGTREFPQFFLLNVSDGAATFWGGIDKLESVNDDAMLEDKVARSMVGEAHAQGGDGEGRRDAAAAIQSCGWLNHVGSVNDGDVQIDRSDAEKELRAQLDSKQQEIETLMRAREHMESQLTLELEESNRECLTKSNLVTKLEQKLIASETRLSQNHSEMQKLITELVGTRNGWAQSEQDHANLKVRVRQVATELKERRVECRALKTQIDEFEKQNDELSSTVERLSSQLASNSRSESQRNDELEDLRVTVFDLTSQLESARVRLAHQVVEGESSLLEYKKKAQSSLAAANSRTAAAIRAREDAELDAQSARALLEDSTRKARQAESFAASFRQELKLCKEQLESEIAKKTLAKVQTSSTQEGILRFKASLEKSEKQTVVLFSENKLLKDHIRAARLDCIREQKEHMTTAKMLREAQTEVGILRNEIQADADFSKNQKITGNEVQYSEASDQIDLESFVNLKQQLSEASKVEKELREALKTAMQWSCGDGNGRGGADFNIGEYESEPPPLYFAMQKQAELKMASDEINRLATLLADVQTEKTEALQSMEKMRRQMEDNTARLRRVEKLGIGGASVNSSDVQRSKEMERHGAVNIEYLKNVILRFLQTETLTEKKALVSVIGAVLCFTDDEKKQVVDRKAMQMTAPSVFEALTGR